MNKYKFAGISVVHTLDGAKKRHFNATKLEGTIGVWLDVPGKVEYNFVKLPSSMTKLEAAKWLKASDIFTTKADQDFLQSVIEKRDPVAKEPKPRKKVGKKKTHSELVEAGIAATEPVMTNTEEPAKAHA